MSWYLRNTDSVFRKGPNQTHIDFAREKGILFNWWCVACKADDFASVRELMLLEEFKSCVPERTAVYLNEQKASTLQQAATLADEFALTHKSVLAKCNSPRQVSQKSGSQVPGLLFPPLPKPRGNVSIATSRVTWLPIVSLGSINRGLM